MKTFKLILTSILCLAMVQVSAQSKTEKFKVAGECGMCKKKIEKAAKDAGASYALWNTESKELTVKYASTSSNKAKISKAIANVGYDTPDFKATDEAYNSLHDCCKYERKGTADGDHKCCGSEKCDHSSCMKDGKCTHDMSCCKDSGCDKKDCCKKS